jgi:large repetitive protein
MDPSCGITNVSGQGTSSISFRFASSFTSGSVSVVVGGCNTSETRSISVSRITPATPGAIAGPSNVCAFRGTGIPASYSIAPVAGALSYTWTVPTNVTLVSANGGTSIEVLVASAFTSGNITVRANSGCANSNTRTISLNTSIPGTPGNIAGNARACPGDVRTYSISAVTNATGYVWTVPTGTSIVSGAGTTTIQLAFDAAFTHHMGP